jgi:hypothetical protein
MAPVVHPGRLLKREMTARKLSANRLSLDIGVPSGRITDILNFRRGASSNGRRVQRFPDVLGRLTRREVNDVGWVERSENPT